MENVLHNKKLLILGASSAEVTLVKRAQALGCYVIVTDNREDWSLSPAKYVADEAWNVSWSDMESLTKLCKENGIDGITAGYSEFRVENLIKLCKILGLPCYITMEQLDITRDKIRFKEACRKYRVPVVNEYDNPEVVTSFPLIVKPVDRGGSIGISIATDAESLKKAYAYAMDMSVTKQVIIEDFIDCGVKVDLYYSVQNGKITMMSTCDTINATANAYERVVQSSWLYPAKREKELLDAVDGPIRDMIRGLGIQNGCITYSGFQMPDGKVVIFECGFRMEGAHQYEYINKKGLYNSLDIFITHALLGNSEIVKPHETQNPRMKSVVINLYAKKGEIGVITGMKDIAAMPDCTLTIQSGRVGEKCQDNKAILDKVGMFSFCSESPAALRRDVEEGYRRFCLKDTKGNDMLYDRIDTSVIESWWD